MSVARWSHYLLGSTGALAVGGGILLLPATGERRFDDVVFVAFAAMLGGFALGVLHWLVMNHQKFELQRLASHIDLIGRSGSQAEASTADFSHFPDLAAVAASVDRATQSLNARINQLVNQRRELEVHARIAEAERRHAEAILNSISDAVVVTDAFNEVALANHAAARVLDFDLESARRKPIDRVIHDPTLVSLIKDTREAGDALMRRHVEHTLGRNGQDATFDVSLSCVTEGKGATETAGVVAILRDITREKEIAEMKSDFVSNVSHELRTPLSSIKAYMEMLIDGEAQDDETRTEFYNIVQGEANRLSRLIDNILNISRIESGVVKVQRESVVLASLIEDAINVLLPQARANQIDLVQIPSADVFQIFADRDMIYQALLNLLGNAVKYTPTGGKVTVALAVDSHARLVSVSITDTGIGIPASDLPRVFDKFFRVADHKKLAQGTGLGLNLVRHIIETVHGGKVRVISEVNKGSAFTFTLPMAENT